MRKQSIFIFVTALIALMPNVFAIDTSKIMFYYGFENDDISGTNTLLDQIGRYNMQIFGSPVTGIAGRVGNTFVFDGVNDFLKNLSHHAKDDYNSGLTYNFWIRLNSTSGDPTVYMGEDGGAGGRQQFTFFPTATITFGCGGGCTIDPGLNGNGILNQWTMITTKINSSGIYLYVNAELNASSTTATMINGANDFWIGVDKGEAARFFDGAIDEFSGHNDTGGLSQADITELYNGGNGINPLAEEPNTIPPEITSYDMTSQGGCTNWNTSKSNPCSTSDTTPTTFITTKNPASCRVGKSDLNYTLLGDSRNCTGAGSTEHTCTLTPQDELTYVNSQIFIGCKNINGYENLTSTSGALSLTITGLEEGAANAIETGIQNALLTGYTIYTDQQVFARDLSNNQDTGTFDRVVKKGSKTWAFNYITDGEAHVGLFNLTHVLFVLEMANATNSTITNLVETMINNTR